MSHKQMQIIRSAVRNMEPSKDLQSDFLQLGGGSIVATCLYNGDTEGVLKSTVADVPGSEKSLVSRLKKHRQSRPWIGRHDIYRHLPCCEHQKILIVESPPLLVCR